MPKSPTGLPSAGDLAWHLLLLFDQSFWVLMAVAAVTLAVAAWAGRRRGACGGEARGSIADTVAAGYLGTRVRCSCGARVLIWWLPAHRWIRG